VKSSSSSSFPSYLGCLNLTASELQDSWIFPGTAPSCSYVHHSGSSSGGSGGGSSGGSGSSSGSSGSSGGSSSSGGSGSSSGSSGSNGGSSSGDDNGSSNNGDGSSSSGNNGSGGDSSSNNGGDSSSSGNNGSGGDSSNNNGGDDSSNNNAYNGNVDEEGRNYGDQDGNGYNGGGNGGNSGSGYSDDVVTNEDYVSGYGYNGQDDGNDNQDDGYNGYSGDGSSSPYSDFDIATCDTYENLWLWDFSLTCDDADNLENCECNFAEEMMDSGLLSCDAAAECPADCAICNTCFQVLGCATGGSGGLNSAQSASNFLYVIAAGAGVLFFGIVYYSANKRRGNKDLGAHLMEDEGASGTGTVASSHLSPPVWLTPDEASPSEISASNLPSSPVWLAPDSPPAQFEPSSEAAIESSGQSSHQPAPCAFIPGIFPVSSDESSSDPEDDFPASSDLLSEPEANVWLAPLT
jgi:hypothetical protein